MGFNSAFKGLSRISVQRNMNPKRCNSHKEEKEFKLIFLCIFFSSIEIFASITERFCQVITESMCT